MLELDKKTNFIGKKSISTKDSCYVLVITITQKHVLKENVALS